MAVQTHRALRERLDVAKLSITDIFQFPTLGALADRVAKLGGGTSQSAAGVATVTAIPQPAASDRAQSRADAMARRREMRARRQA